ncbi:MAG: acetate--CoA ligase family protein [Caldisphaera sp.]|jgi:acetyl coenzyme A synthetase (ADP forming)-like protein|nr:acetate--CoA ligase family protein [Caldisphaera sp.]
MQKSSIDIFFEPKSIAIIGASPREGNMGRVILENLKKNFKEKIFVVNPKYEDVLNIKSYSSLNDIKDDIDVAIIAVDASKTLDIMKDVAEKKVKGVIIISGGFAETDSEEGIRVQNEVKDFAEKNGIRVLGPNCIGVYNAHNGIDTFFLPYERMRRPKKGPISIISQSGALLATLMDWAASKNIKIGKAINFGNKIDVDEIESMEYFGKDNETRVILMYLEGINPGKGRDFIETARRVTSIYKKPIILIKGGKTSNGAKAAKSHTASLAGSYDVFKAAAKQANIIIADDLEELFDIARVMSFNIIPLGNRVGIITNSGGHGVIASDKLAEYGLIVPELSDNTKKELRKIFPLRVSLHNPVDFTGDATPQHYEKVLEMMVKNDEADMFLIIALLQPSTMDLSIANIISNFTKKHFERPIAVVTIGAEHGEKLKELLENEGIPTFEFPDRASKALAMMSKCIKCSGKSFESCKKEELQKDAILETKKIVEKAINEDRMKLFEDEALRILNINEIETPNYCVAHNTDQLIQCKDIIKYPVAMKIISPDIIHKTDVGGVILNVEDDNRLIDGYYKLIKNVKNNLPKARINGVLIQEIVKNGQEIIIGGKRDLAFGPVVLFGLGGIYTEVLGDVSMRIAPIDSCDAKEMIEEIKSIKILEGYRGLEPVDKNALALAIMRVGELMINIPEITEMDINPVIANKKGALAVDARIIINRGGLIG